MANNMKIKIDEEKCIGCGSCVAVCPDCFEMTDDNKARLKNEVADKECSDECTKEAVDICPVQVIKVEEQ